MTLKHIAAAILGTAGSVAAGRPSHIPQRWAPACGTRHTGAAGSQPPSFSKNMYEVLGSFFHLRPENGCRDPPHVYEHFSRRPVGHITHFSEGSTKGFRLSGMCRQINGGVGEEGDEHTGAGSRRACQAVGRRRVGMEEARRNLSTPQGPRRRAGGEGTRGRRGS